MSIRRRSRRRTPIAPDVPALEHLEVLADAAIDLAHQISATVAELRREDDERGRDEPAE